MPLNQPRFIGSASPFEQWSRKYFDGGFSPIPLPPNTKNPPPTGWTGHGRPTTTEQQLEKWLAGEGLNKLFKGTIKRANIALRLNTVVVDGVSFDLVGIDVDHHPEDKDDPKNGGPQLEYFERKLGALPPTWTSSARVNGISGIRLFRAPAGLMWRGDLGHGGEDIDVISKNYRFLVCFPSTNPDANNRQYWFYPPGFKPDGDLEAIDREKHGLVPDPKKLPLLPDAWIDYLTQNRIKDVGVPMDMDATAKQLTRWATRNFASNDSICEYLTIEVDKYKQKIEESAKSHNVLTAFHNKILRCGANEGHTGWGKACAELEKAYVANVLARGKRTVTSAEKEIERSRYGALRRIKGEADIEIKAGRGYFAKKDQCDLPAGGVGEIKGPPGIGGDWPHTKPEKGPGDYTNNDDGNGEHFLDFHDGHVLYVSNVLQHWMIWNGSRWVVDEKDDIARHLYRRVKESQMIYAAGLWASYMQAKGTQGAPEKKALAEKWVRHARSSGMVRDIDRALIAARSVRQGISIKYEDLDKDHNALGCVNGVVRLTNSGGIEVVENAKELLITKNTGLSYIPLRQQKGVGKKLFKDFLDKFIAPSLDIEYFQKLCGSALIGSNSEKMALFFWGPTDTGKSTMLELMVKALGDYAGTRQPDIFKSQHLNPQLAHALSLRLVGVSEMGENEINSELFKNITGGETITVELKGSNNLVSAIPQFTPIITTNSIPRVPGEDTAFRNRLRVIEFKHQASEMEKLSGNQKELYEHGLEAVLAWLIEGAAKYVREGLLPVPVEILMATEEFASKLSDLADFAQENLEISDGGFVRGEDIFFRFRQWADANNFNQKGWGRTRLTQKLKALGYKHGRAMINIGGDKKEQQRGFMNVKLTESNSVHSNEEK